MPFAVHTMDPGCPVVAVEETAEKAAESAERLGYAVGTARVMILPCARTTDDAMAAAEERDNALRRLEYAEEEIEFEKREAKSAIEDLSDAESRADDAEERIEKAQRHLRAAIKRAEKVDPVAQPRLFGSIADDAMRDALKILKGESLDAVAEAV